MASRRWARLASSLAPQLSTTRLASNGVAPFLLPGRSAIPLACGGNARAASARYRSGMAMGMGVPMQAAVPGARSLTISALSPSDSFPRRHNSATAADVAEMVEACGFSSLDALIDATVPPSIRLPKPMDLKAYNSPRGESEHLARFKAMASKNVVNKSYLGMGYYGTHVPPVILRNILENPGWYTQYTPYQAEISQGRLESLLNFQTLITDMTGMPMANASLLDEATAAAEAMTMCSAIARGKKTTFVASDKCHPQTLAVCHTRAQGLGLNFVVAPESEFASRYASKDVCGVLVQYPATDGGIHDYKSLASEAHAAGVKVVAATDLLALTLLTPPGEWGADMVLGSAQRFGVPMGFGGPHAAFLATSEEYKRLMPGRIIGVSIDATGAPALRMAMQTREQHIRRDKATSNICTAQALLANMAAMYAVYHGPEGLRTIARRVHGLAEVLSLGATSLGWEPPAAPFFDTVSLRGKAGAADKALAAGHRAGLNLRKLDDRTVVVSLDETTTLADVDAILAALGGGAKAPAAASFAPKATGTLPDAFARTSPFLTHPVFHAYHSEHEMLRYLARLEARDLSLKHSMIALGSCTMKLNATSEMIPITWPELAEMHPYAPQDQTKGYTEMLAHLAEQLCIITGFDGMSLQPNSGASGEYAGLMAIRGYHHSRGEAHRDVCIIPTSAHGTNPASAVMAGMRIVTVGVTEEGNINLDEVRAAAAAHSKNLAALMVTYPSTHGVYEDGIDEMCKIIHQHGGQVYMDGANMNAQVGLTSPGFIGADVCHLNLHKTFCIPHGGGGPGMGPIGVKKQLVPFLPSHPVVPTGSLPPGPSSPSPFGTVAAAPFGSALILPISYSYIALMGSEGLTMASKLAILNANYMARRLESHYPVLFRGKNGTCAHEFILDLRPLTDATTVSAEDIAKRLMDYGYHAPTMSWPVSGTLMIEPTESESKAELDRFVAAMVAIRREIAAIETGAIAAADSPLKHAPHTATAVAADAWGRAYSRETAAFPAEWVRHSKFWPTVARVDNVYGDRHLVTKLSPPVEASRRA